MPQMRISSLLFQGFLLVVMFHWGSLGFTWPYSLLRDFQRGLNTLAGVRGNPQRNLRRLGGKLLLIIPKGKRLRAQKKGNFSRFARSKGNALKLSQGPDRLGNTCSLETEVALHRFDARARPGVGDVRASAQNRAWSVLAALQVIIQTLRANLCFVDAEISVAEGRVRQAVAKGKLRAVLFVDVTRNIFLEAIARWPGEIDFSGRAPGIQGVVIQRFLADASRPAHDKLSARILF